MSEEYHYIKIKTYPGGQPVERCFYNVTDLSVNEKIENAPAFNVNSFYYIGDGGMKYHMEIQGKITEKVKLA